MTGSARPRQVVLAPSLDPAREALARLLDSMSRKERQMTERLFRSAAAALALVAALGILTIAFWPLPPY